ncbi:MAG: CopD family protein [Parasphingorhabdus sp.]|nr:CopD family protein [Parasphingorhabdus sp.]
MTALLVFLALCLGIYIFDRDNFYLWAKAIHIMAVIAWMAGMFYMPRLFVYHADTTPGSESSETFKVMEYRLMKAIMNPAMILTWIFGLYLAWEGFGFPAVGCMSRFWRFLCYPGCMAISAGR